MCGIAGIIGPAGRDAPEALGRSLDLLRHRGPDESGTYVNEDVLIGMRRLSIIDVGGGRQPIFNECGDVAVVFNGEIYNFLELARDLIRRGHSFKTQSDTEVLVHLYEQHGIQMVDQLRGMFAIAIIDLRTQTTYLIRDRFGKKPLYYQSINGSFAFASELKALEPLAASLGARWQISERSIYDYLSFGVIPQPDTVFEHVHAVPPASFVCIGNGAASTNSYWHPRFEPKFVVPYRQLVNEVQEIVADAVAIRLRSDVPLGVFLSGGIDSTVVAYEAARTLGGELQTFTVAVDDKELDESALARRTADALGVRNTTLRLSVSPLEELQTVVRTYDQPFADPSAIPSLAISRLAREHVKVILNGDGGDELFGGYRRHLAAHLTRWIDVVPASFRQWTSGRLSTVENHRRSAAGLFARVVRGISLPPDQRYLAWTTDMLRESDKLRIWVGSNQRPTESIVAGALNFDLNGLDRQMAADLRLNLLSDLLVKMDMATSAASIEARSPLLDHKVAEYAFRVPAFQRLRRLRTKGLLRDAYGSRVPREVIAGKKKGFEIPLDRWLRDDLRTIVNDTLRDPQAYVNNFVDARWVRDLVDKKTNRDLNWGYLVYSLLVLELWFRERHNR